MTRLLQIGFRTEVKTVAVSQTKRDCGFLTRKGSEVRGWGGLVMLISNGLFNLRSDMVC